MITPEYPGGSPTDFDQHGLRPARRTRLALPGGRISCRSAFWHRLWLLLAGSFLLLSCGTEQGDPSPNKTRLLILGDGTEIRHQWDEAGPLPASNDWISVEVAGYFLAEDEAGPGFSWTWTFTLKLVHPEVDLVAISDVTDPEPGRLVTAGEGLFTDDKWLAQSEPVPVSAFHQPWLFRDGESVRILRFSVADSSGETRILYQPIVFTHETKRRLVGIAGPSGAGITGP